MWQIIPLCRVSLCWMSLCWVWWSIVLFEIMLLCQISRIISETTRIFKSCMTVYFIYLFLSLKILRCWFHQRSFLPTPFPLSTNTTSLSPLICSLCFSLPPICPLPRYILPVCISHKYWANLMFDYHWINLIEPKRLSYLGIAHNMT